MSYNPALDGVRALSILAVLVFHCQISGVAEGGFLGVDVFFVLSGYLITSLLAREHRDGGIEIGPFYARRALRLYPSLLILLVAYLALAPFLWPQDPRWLLSGLAGSYLMDYALAFRDLPLTIGQTWSLGVEEKFYLLWPLLLPIILRARRPIAWLLSAFLLISAWRYFVTATWGWKRAYFSFDTRMSGILLGAIAALSQPKVSGRTAAVAGFALLVGIALPTSYGVTEAEMPRLTLAELSAFVLICYLAEHPKTRFISSRPMVYVGRLSYGIYLWHVPAIFALQTQPLWLKLSVTLLFSFTMAALCLHWVDAPLKVRVRSLRAGRSDNELRRVDNAYVRE